MPISEGGVVESAAPPADDLQIAGLVPLSTVDWPGKLVASVFCQGCPWNCPYCHNHALIDMRMPGLVDWDEVRALLARRRGLLDGVVFSGGEAARQDALVAAAREVKESGFLVGLHSAGCYPKKLEELLAAGLVDWVGLDVKAMPENYGAVAGVGVAAQKAWDSLRVVLGNKMRGNLADYEIRLTIFPGGPRDAVQVAHALKEEGVENFALQVARAQGAREGFVDSGPGWGEYCESVAQVARELGFETFTYRD
ncbi:MAG: anaerobic ribonucleoside-triphosphate reductase activating protein [Actinomycetaceae bacterium]|nr:anaerobic ribonucleoside-triphosphate reductase activating protein [Actinomycetaceae bacterium]